MVGEDDDLIGSRRVGTGALDPPELLVELAQGLERIRALEPRVVRNLVIAREGCVDRGPPLHHVREHAVHDQIPDDHTQRRPHERVEAAPVTAGTDVPPLGLARRRPLEQDFPTEEDEHADDVEAVREEGAIAGI